MEIENNKIEFNDLPVEIRKFNWGAFLLTWIWGLGNKTYIALLILLINIIGAIPHLPEYLASSFSFAFSVYLGIKGNELAWKNKQWQDVEHFNKVQKKWAVWGVVISLLFIVLLVLLGVLLLSKGLNTISN